MHLFAIRRRVASPPLPSPKGRKPDLPNGRPGFDDQLGGRRPSHDDEAALIHMVAELGQEGESLLIGAKVILQHGGHI